MTEMLMEQKRIKQEAARKKLEEERKAYLLQKDTKGMIRFLDQRCRAKQNNIL